MFMDDIWFRILIQEKIVFFNHFNFLGIKKDGEGGGVETWITKETELC